jgi:hypothetical protein
MALEPSPGEPSAGDRGVGTGPAEPRSFRPSDPAASVHVLGPQLPGGDLQRALEQGGVLLLPMRPFDLGEAADVLFAISSSGRAKNVSYDPRTQRLKGGRLEPAAQAAAAVLLARWGDWCETLLAELVPAYAGRLRRGKASFRPRPADAPVRAHKDDRRLHVDSFPAQPVRGRRILRVFRNINPLHEARLWHVGEPFGDYAARFLPRASRQPWGLAAVLQAFGLTKGLRSRYDHLMLQLHDAAKADDAYQAQAPRRPIRFPPGATWVLFSDAVPHAALKGRYALEQTFFLPVAAMADPEASPLRVLERMTGRRLA